MKFKEQDDPKQNQEAAWKELEYLASNGKLLLFVDNVNVSMGEDPGLKRLMSIPGEIVLTSRRRVLSKEFEPYRIGFLSTGKCKEIYEKIRFENSDTRVAEEEVPDLEYIIDTLTARHTITIELLAHLARTNNWIVKKLREELEKNGFQLEYMDEEEKLVNIQKSYEILYDMSVLTKAEQNILEAFSVFPYIPLNVKICNQWLLADAGVDKENYALMKLYQKGWLQFDMEQESYALHPVFAQFIYEKYKPKIENHRGLIELCQKKVDTTKGYNLQEVLLYIPFAENILKKIDMGNGMERVKFVSVLAQTIDDCSQDRYEVLKKIENWYKGCLKILVQIGIENQIEAVHIYEHMAKIYREQKKYEIAKELYKKV